MKTRTWPVTAVAVLALAISLSACASDAIVRRSGAARTMGPSRAAAVVRYDIQYLRDLEKWINKLREEQKDPALRDDVGLLFALDELAEVYAFRSVNFEGARVANGEAVELLRRVRQEAQGRIGWYFNPNRRLYAFLMGPFKSFQGITTVEAVDDDVGVDSGLRWTGRASEPVKSVYSPSVLRRAFAADLELVADRIAARERFLDEVTGSRGAREASQSPPEGEEASVAELKIWGETFRSVGEPARSWLLLERVWGLHDQMGREAWVAKVIETGRPLIAAPDRDGEGLVIGIVARLRVGYAHLLAGEAQMGVGLVEEALGLVEAFDRNQESGYQAARSGMYKAAGLSAAQGVLNLGGGPLGWAMGALHIALGSAAVVLQEQMIRAQYGEGRHGLATFLTEAERIGFHFEMGRAYEATGHTAKAIEQYKRAIEIIERQRATIRTEAGRIRYLRDKEAPYKRLIPLLLRTGDAAGAFEYSERARSRAFLDLLASGQVRLGTPEEAGAYERLVRQQAETEVLVEAGQLPRPLAVQVRALLRDVEVQPVPQNVSLQFESLTSVQVAKVEEISGVLGKDAALLTFFVGDDETTVLLVQDGSIAGWIRPVGRSDMVGMVGRFRQVLHSPLRGSARDGDIEELNTTGARLYRELLGSVLEAVKKPIVYIVPHGPLHYLPFAAIHDGRAYLLDRFTLAMVPSGTVLTYLEKKTSTGGPVVVLANPDLDDPRLDLRHAELEGTGIRAGRQDVVLLTRKLATEARLREWAPKARALHLAAHATLDVQRPLESAVLLAPGDGQDGRLTAGEVFGLRLPGSLVVLSACETGLGQIATGDELIGLTRAFMYAGAPHIVATLWRVEDESTAALMVEFYKRMSAVPVAEALRQAQQNVRTRYPHPFFWAPFSVFGHHR